MRNEVKTTRNAELQFGALVSIALRAESEFGGLNRVKITHGA